MIQARATFVERLRALQVRKLVEGDEVASQQPDDVVEGTRVLVDQRIGAEQSVVPGTAPSKVGHGQGNMRYRGKLGHLLASDHLVVSRR
jgi:hypothetical protein